MCLLVARKSLSLWSPSPSEQSNAWSSNPHGFGAAWISKSKNLVYQKTLKQSEVASIIKSIPKGSPCLLHWRMATHGLKTIENCHPFPCYGNNWIGAHNGVLHQQVCQGSLTDSESFLREQEGSEPNIPELELKIDSLGYGKFAFLSNKGEIRIANELDGEWRVEGEVWQSNSGLDSVPWYSHTYGSGFGFRGKKRAMLCESCDQHVPLFMVGRDYLCEDCAEVML